MLRQLVLQLQAAERAGDRVRWTAVADQAIHEGEALQRLYAEAAPSPDVKLQLEREHAMALGEGAASSPPLTAPFLAGSVVGF